MYREKANKLFHPRMSPLTRRVSPRAGELLVNEIAPRIYGTVPRSLEDVELYSEAESWHRRGAKHAPNRCER